MEPRRLSRSSSGEGIDLTQDFTAILDGAAGLEVLCLGDVMLDLTIECHPDRISPEAPVLVAGQGRSVYSPGGAANVAANLSGLGVRTHLVSACGDDDEGRELLRLLAETAISVHMERGQASTTLKTRFVAEGRQLLRLDRDGVLPATDPAHGRIAAQLDRKSVV